MGGSYLQEFAACGGTIGRSLECDWPLPDSKRFISSRHAMIDYQGGAYYLVDLSRNGVYINGSDTPVGAGNPQRLFDGDLLRMGEFEMQVALIDDPNESDEDGMRDSVVRAQMVQEDESMELAMLPADQIRDEYALDAILRPGDASGELSALSELPPKAVELFNIAASQRALHETTDEFLKAAGLNPDDFRGIEPKVLLNNAAHLLGEFVDGTHALLIAKDKIMAGLEIKSQAPLARSNPLRSADGVDNALRLLLGKSNDVHEHGTKAVEAAFDELQQHQRAVINAMRNALGDYLGYFEPQALERHFSELKKRTGTSTDAFRDLYAQAFAGLAQPNQHKLPQVFDEEFARSYELETTE
jgi:type VI secretion system protein ImpI